MYYAITQFNEKPITLVRNAIYYLYNNRTHDLYCNLWNFNKMSLNVIHLSEEEAKTFVEKQKADSSAIYSKLEFKIKFVGESFRLINMASYFLVIFSKIQKML